MKTAEISQFEVEFLEHDENKNRKLKNKIFYLIEIENYITIIDIRGDKELHKIYLNKGQGLHRINNSDIFEMKTYLWNHKG